jgi:hypothetical protein
MKKTLELISFKGSKNDLHTLEYIGAFEDKKTGNKFVEIGEPNQIAPLNISDSKFLEGGIMVHDNN